MKENVNQVHDSGDARSARLINISDWRTQPKARPDLYFNIRRHHLCEQLLSLNRRSQEKIFWH
jgi:hypothetical protein